MLFVPRISGPQGAGLTGIADEADNGLDWANGFANYWLPYCMTIASPLLAPFAKEITLLSLAAWRKGTRHSAGQLSWQCCQWIGIAHGGKAPHARTMG
jgi:hypothetical protein